jgi:hypothetical protein
MSHQKVIQTIKFGYVGIGKVTRKPRNGRWISCYCYAFSAHAMCTCLHSLLSHHVVQTSIVLRLLCFRPVVLCLCLLSLMARFTQVLVLALKDCGSSADSAEGLGGNGRAVGANGGTNGHEEAKSIGQWRSEALQNPHIPKSRR